MTADSAGVPPQWKDAAPAENAGVVYIVEDDEDARASLAEALGSYGMTVRTFADATSFLDQATLVRPGCVVMDLRLPSMSGIEALETLRDRGVSIPAIVVSGYGSVDSAVRAMKAGASDFVEKPFRPRDLEALIQSCLERDQQRSRLDISRQELRDRVATLTSREQQVLDLVASGAANKEVARSLDVSPRTVEHHRARVMRKLGARSLAELVFFTGILEWAEGNAVRS